MPPLFIFFSFSFVSVVRLCQCSTPLLIYYFLSRLWLVYTNVLCLFIYTFLLFVCDCGSVLPMFYASLFIVFFFYARVFVLPMFYASLYIVFYFCVCESVLSMFYANLFVVFFSFLLCLWLSLAIFLCRFFHVLLSFVSVCWFCQCSTTH